MMNENSIIFSSTRPPSFLDPLSVAFFLVVVHATRERGWLTDMDGFCATVFHTLTYVVVCHPICLF